MSDQGGDQDRPPHSVDNAEQKKPHDHEVDAPKERTDDDVRSDDEQTTKRQE